MLIGLLDDGEASAAGLRRWIVVALRDLKDPRAAPALRAALDDPVVADVAAEALLSLGQDPTEGLRSALQDPSAEVRVTAIRGIAEKGLGALAPEIVALDSDPDRDVRAAVAEGLAELAAFDWLPALFRLLEDPERWVRVRAARAKTQTAPLMILPPPGTPQTAACTIT